MTPRNPGRVGLGLVVVALAGAACARTGSPKVKDSGAAPQDLASVPDGSADQNPGHSDAGADTGGDASDAGAIPGDPGRDAAAPDSAVAGKEAGRESRVSLKDTAAESHDQGTGIDGGEPSACSGILSFGDYLMSAAPGLHSPMVMADLDGDGRLDLVSPGRVVFGNGNGTFSDPVDFSAGATSGMALGDLNGDGRLDMVTVGNGVSVLLGQDDGTFLADAVYTSGKGSASVALVDLNGDGRLDVVTANHDANSVSVLLGKGDGTLGANTDSPTGNGPATVLLGDVNGDGRLDVVTVNAGADSWGVPTVSTLLGAGNGNFSDRLDTQGGADPGTSVTAALGDLNGDGKLDLVVTSPGTTKVLLGTGDGRFAAPVSGTWGDHQQLVAVSDLNGDGMLDVVVLMSGIARVLPGRGDGTFAAALDSPISGDLQAVALGDVNGDGKADLVLSMSSGGANGALDVLFGSGRGTFGSALIYPTGSAPSAMAIGDVNADGKIDVVTASQSGGTVSVLVGKGGGALAANADYTVGKEPFAVALGDLNGDGSLDIVTVNQAPSDTSIATISVLLGKGDGTFAAKRDFVSADGPTALALGDLNGDGNLDIVTTSGASFQKGTVNVLFGKGDGTFSSTTSFEAGNNTQGIALGDLNGDGALDMVVANAGVEDDGSVTVMLGKGDGTFPSSTDYRKWEGASSVALGDLNGDGALDIVLVGGWVGGGSVLLGSGDGTFAEGAGYATATGPNSLVLGDLNGDGWLDVVVADGSPGMISVALGQGDGTFSPSMNIAFDTVAQALTDLNGDGRLDMVALTGTGVAVLLGSCR